MSYKVLARKWRPRHFAQVVGQSHVVRVLENAIAHDRMHHAYLFAGTRGVGKTTLARVLAKALNCERPKAAEPCGHCAVCTDIDDGRFIDLIEVDAASRTGVDDTRDLLENVQYAPSRGRYKVYLIDEVHMFSNSSFNALLKTLEEPPPHVKFLLATTDPQKVPVTVLSRCLQFNLKRLMPNEIQAQLQHILEEENIPFEAEALKALAKAADGSMRDGLSLLDQAIVHGNGEVNSNEVFGMLGCVAQQPVMDLLMALVGGDAETVMESVSAMDEFVPDYGQVLQSLLSYLHQMALAQQVPSADIDPQLHTLSSQLGREELQLYYQIGLIGQRDLPLAPDPRSGFEMVLLRMLAFQPSTPGQQNTVTATQKANPTPQTAPTSSAPSKKAAGKLDLSALGRPSDSKAVKKKPLKRVVPEPEHLQQQTPNVAPPPAKKKPVDPPEDEKDFHQTSQKNTVGSEEAPKPLDLQAQVPAMGEPWHVLVPKLDLDPMTLQLANNLIVASCEAEEWSFLLTAGYANLNPRSEGRLEEALSAFAGTQVRVKIKESSEVLETPLAIAEAERKSRQYEAEQSIQNNPTVQALLETFGGHIVPGTIHPID